MHRELLLPQLSHASGAAEAITMEREALPGGGLVGEKVYASSSFAVVSCGLPSQAADLAEDGF